jgi:hypothetical protein
VSSKQKKEYAMPNSGTTVPVVLIEDDPIHTNKHPFCSMDPHCLCHEDPVLITEVAHFVEDGLLTPDEATSFVAGKLLDEEKEDERP